jgi:prevent-host-death family protein
MRTVNIHEAKTHLSKLVERAAAGEPFIIAKAGHPLVRVVPLDTPVPGMEVRIGSLEGLAVPDDFDEMGREEVRAAFEGVE